MRKYGALSWKRTWLWSCSRRIEALDKGPMSREEKLSAKPTTTRYQDKSGKTRFKGNSGLKPSQSFVLAKYVFYKGVLYVNLFPEVSSKFEPKDLASCSGHTRTGMLQSLSHWYPIFVATHDPGHFPSRRSGQCDKKCFPSYIRCIVYRIESG